MPDLEKPPISDTAVISVGVCMTMCFLLLIGAFIYKVWNERQMTREYHEQAIQLNRIADAIGSFQQAGIKTVVLSESEKEFITKGRGDPKRMMDRILNDYIAAIPGAHPIPSGCSQ